MVTENNQNSIQNSVVSSQKKTEGEKIVGIKGMGRKSYIAVSGMGFIAAAQTCKLAVIVIGIVALVGMLLQWELDNSDKNEET